MANKKQNGSNVDVAKQEVETAIGVFGADYGKGDKARYNAAVLFGKSVDDGLYTLDDANKLARIFYTEMSKASGRPMAGDLSINALASQWKAFATPQAVKAADATAKQLAEFMAGKKRSEVGKDFFQMAYGVNVKLKEKPEAKIDAALMAAVAAPKPANRPQSNGATDYVAMLREAAEKVLATLDAKSRKKADVAKRETLAEVLQFFAPAS